MVFFRNLVKLTKICIPKFLSKETLGVGVLTTSMVGRTFLSIWMAEVTSTIVKTIVNKDLTAFVENITILVGLSLPGAFINSLIDYMNK